MTDHEQQGAATRNDYFLDLAKQTHQRTKVTIAILVVAILVVDVALTLIGARLTYGGQQREARDLADRVDRNAAFTACVLAVDPSERSDVVIVECLTRANARFGTDPPPPPTLIPPESAEAALWRGLTEGVP